MRAKRLHKKMLNYNFAIVHFLQHCHLHLPSNEREALFQFEQKFCNMLGKTILYIPFSAVRFRSCKIKQIWVFEHIGYHVGLAVYIADSRSCTTNSFISCNISTYHSGI